MNCLRFLPNLFIVTDIIREGLKISCFSKSVETCLRYDAYFCLEIRLQLWYFSVPWMSFAQIKKFWNTKVKSLFYNRILIYFFFCKFLRNFTELKVFMSFKCHYSYFCCWYLWWPQITLYKTNFFFHLNFIWLNHIFKCASD